MPPPKVPFPNQPSSRCARGPYCSPAPARRTPRPATLHVDVRSVELKPDFRSASGLLATSQITPAAIGMAPKKTNGRMVDTTHPLACADAENTAPDCPRRIAIGPNRRAGSLVPPQTKRGTNATDPAGRAGGRIAVPLSGYPLGRTPLAAPRACAHLPHADRVSQPQPGRADAPSQPEIGITASRTTDLGERPHPIFPHARASRRDHETQKGLRATMAEIYQAEFGGSRKSLVSFHCFRQVSQFTVV